MSKIMLIDTEYVKMWYHPEAKIVHHEFQKFIYGQEFRDVLNKGLEVFKEKGAHKWLSDDRKNSALPMEDGVWAVSVWSKEVLAAGWKYWAIVMPDKVAGQMNMNRFMKEYLDKGLVMQVFEDADEALRWLETVDAVEEKTVPSKPDAK